MEQANIGSDAPKENWDLEKLIAKLQQYDYSALIPYILIDRSINYAVLWFPSILF